MPQWWRNVVPLMPPTLRRYCGSAITLVSQRRADEVTMVSQSWVSDVPNDIAFRLQRSLGDIRFPHRTGGITARVGTRIAIVWGRSVGVLVSLQCRTFNTSI